VVCRGRVATVALPGGVREVQAGGAVRDHPGAGEPRCSRGRQVAGGGRQVVVVQCSLQNPLGCSAVAGVVVQNPVVARWWSVNP